MNKKIVMKDLAEILGVSINAVSLALNNKPGVSDELRQRVLSLADELGYIHNQPRYERTYRNNYLCIILKRRYFSASNFYSQVLLGIQEEAADNGYGTLIEIYDDIPNSIPDSISQRRVSGIVVLGVVNEDYLLELMEYSNNIITVDHISHQLGIDSIMTSNVEGAYALTDHVLNKGYKRLGFFGDLDYSTSIRERFNGFIMRIRESNKDKSFKQIMEEIDPCSICYDLEGLIVERDTTAIKERLIDLADLPDAFICSNDDAAAELILALEEMNLSVPRDIAVAGFDDSSVALKTVPPLTTVHVEMKVMGREGVRRLLWRLHNPRALATRTSIATKLVVRNSV